MRKITTLCAVAALTVGATGAFAQNAQDYGAGGAANQGAAPSTSSSSGFPDRTGVTPRPKSSSDATGAAAGKTTREPSTACKDSSASPGASGYAPGQEKKSGGSTSAKDCAPGHEKDSASGASGAASGGVRQ